MNHGPPGVPRVPRRHADDPTGAHRTAALRVVAWHPRLAADFDRLNRWWLERWFTVEPLDEAYLRDPQGRIIDAGGEIFFAVEGERVVGCCAAIPHVGRGVELAKLGVDESAHGRGIGQRLCEAVLGFARGRGARCYLVTSSRLAAARRLYARLGFVERPFPFPQPYEESDLYMEHAG